jgi:hypothetical protein
MTAENGSNDAAVEAAGSDEEAQTEALVLARGHVSELDAPITGGEMAVLFRLGKGLAASGMFKDATQASQAFAKLIFGRDLGLSATQAMTDIHIIEGKPEMSANLQASKVRSSVRYEYDVVELTNDRCELQFWKDGEVVGTSEFTIDDAKRAGLVKEKSPWVKYPRNMVFARAMSNGVAWYCPDVMNGIRVYAEGELADVERAEPAATTAPAAAPTDPDANGAAPEDATVVDDPLLTDEDRVELVAAFDAAGVPVEMFLTAVGLDSTDDLTEATALKVREELGKHLAGSGVS